MHQRKSTFSRGKKRILKSRLPSFLKFDKAEQSVNAEKQLLIKPGFHVVFVPIMMTHSNDSHFLFLCWSILRLFFSLFLSLYKQV